MSTKNRKQNGSVLLTVVFVMSILIVFLFGTIALAMAANNRAHVNYSSAQTGITARAVAQSAIKAIGNGTDQGKAYAKAIGKMESGDKLKVGVDLSGSNANTMGHVDDVEISYAGTKKYYDILKEEWLERDVLKFTASVNMAGVQSSSSIYVIKHFEEDSDSNNSGGAGFVTTAGANLTCQTNLWGGSYITLPKLAEAELYQYTNSHTNRGYGDVTQTGQAFRLSNSGAVIEADLYVNNNVYTENWSGVIYPTSGTGVTILGDLYFHNNAIDHFSYVYNGPKDNLEFNKVPFLYVDGKISGGDGKVKLGNGSVDEKSQFPFNVFCGSIEATHQDNQISASIYCMDDDGNSTIKGGKADSDLYIWSNSVVTQAKTGANKNVVNGEVCSNGNLTLGNCVIKGDVRVRGNLTIDGTVTVHGNVVVGGNITNAENIILDAGKYIYNNGFSKTERETIEVDNEKGYYYQYNPFDGMHNDTEGKYLDPKGDRLSGGAFTWDGNFNPNSWVNGHQIGGTPDGLTMYYTLETGYEPTIEDIMNDTVKDHINYSIEAIYSVAPELLNLADGSSDMFYYEVTPKEGTIEKHDTDPYYTYDRDVHYDRKTSSPTTEYEWTYSGDIMSPETYLTAIGEKTVYPEYAKRTVIFGIDQVDDVPIKSTKVLRTMEEVLTEVANPYNNEELPTEIKSIYNKFVNPDGSFTADGESVHYTSMADIIKDNGYKYFEQNNAINDDGTYNTKTATEAQANEAYNFGWGPYISKSCILDGNNLINKNVVINPGNQNILIVVKKADIPSGTKFLVDDSLGGNVYFYIMPGGELSGQGFDLVTKTYWQALKSSTKFKYASTSTTENAGHTDIATLTDPTPNIFIYGGAGSKLNLSNMGFMTMNVLSPGIEGHIKAGNAVNIDSFYYHNFDMLNQKRMDGSTKMGDAAKVFIIGSFNVKGVEIDNMINIIYVTDDGPKEGVGSSGDDEFWYKTLYYSEF